MQERSRPYEAVRASLVESGAPEVVAEELSRCVDEVAPPGTWACGAHRTLAQVEHRTVDSGVQTKVKALTLLRGDYGALLLELHSGEGGLVSEEPDDPSPASLSVTSAVQHVGVRAFPLRMVSDVALNDHVVEASGAVQTKVTVAVLNQIHSGYITHHEHEDGDFSLIEWAPERLEIYVDQAQRTHAAEVVRAIIGASV